MSHEMSLVLEIIGLGICAYLAGSIPFGYVLGRLKGIDLREHGSRNIGATNAGRVLGRKYFVLVLILDAAKGFVPTLAAGMLLFRSEFRQILCIQGLEALWLGVAFLTIAGHNWPCWLGFKGGKGVSTSLGVVLAIYPYYTYPGIVAFLVWLAVVKLTRYVSLGSIFAAAAFLAGYGVLLFTHWSLREQWPLFGFAAMMVGILIWRHAANIQRLRTGTESKFSMQ